MNRYAGDPRWLTARFVSKCTCGKSIRKGERIFYFPTTRTALCQQPCGEKAAAEFYAGAADEAFATGQTW